MGNLTISWLHLTIDLTLAFSDLKFKELCLTSHVISLKFGSLLKVGDLLHFLATECLLAADSLVCICHCSFLGHLFGLFLQNLFVMEVTSFFGYAILV